MGGEGSMMAMIASLRNNSRRKSRTQFDKDTSASYGDGKKLEFDFPEVTPQVLKAIRDKLKKERTHMNLKILCVCIVIVTVLIFLII